jgi:hypothetical protein
MLSIPRHFHGLFLAKLRFSASIEREVDEAEEVSHAVFPSGDEPPEVVHPPRPSVRGSGSGVLPSIHSELPRASPEWHGCYCECCSQTSWKRHSKKCVANRSEENRSILMITDRKTTKSLPF